MNLWKLEGSQVYTEKPCLGKKKLSNYIRRQTVLALFVFSSTDILMYTYAHIHIIFFICMATHRIHNWLRNN